MATIDELTIEVQTKAKDIDNRLDNVTKQLENLATAVGKVNTGSLKDIGVGISALSAGMQGFKSIKMPDFTRLYKGLGKVSDVDSAKIKNVADAINPLANSIKTLNGVNFDSKNITGLINSLTRLSNANVSSLENVDFSKIGGAINSLTHSLQGTEKVSSNTISITNAVAKLASAGAKADIVSASLPKLGNELRDFIQKMSGASKVSQETIQFTQALGTLASTGNKAATTAGNLGLLATELKKFMQVMSTAPMVNGNIIQMTNALANLASQGGHVGSASNGLVRSFNNISTGAKKTHKNILNLAASFGRFYAIFWGIKRAIGALSGAVEYASDLTEVQNVIDVTFGNAKGVIEDFSQSAIKQFGISELAAKQTAGRFQAMGTAIGFSQGKMADMSVELTALSADMASFYNVSQKEVATSLQSIFTGETEPMRRYGIDLTQATLQEWALKQGIDADMQSMSQAEKVMLRYQYVIANTGAATGDFARTSASWANQVRILSEQFKVLGSVIGKGAIAAFKPFIQTLNSVMGKVISFSETVLNALGTIFGWKFEISAGGLTDDLGESVGYTDDLASGAGDASDGYKDAAKNAKKLKDVVLGIDELNINAPDDDTGSAGSSSGKPSGGGGGGIGAGAGAGGLTTNMVASDTILKAYESSIDSLYELGEYIRDTLIKTMDGIEWGKVYERARGFGKGLADFLNGTLAYDGEGKTLFGQVGRTLANTLNTAVYSALIFGQTFDFRQLGINVADGINNVFQNFDFKALANALNVWVDGLWDFIGGFLGKIKPGDIFKGIKDFLGTLELDTIAVIVGAIAWKLGAGALIKNGLLALISKGIGKLTLSLTGVTLGKVTFTGVAKAFGGALKTAIGNASSSIVSMISGAFGISAGASTAVFAGIIAAVVAIGVAIKDLWDTSESFRESVAQMWQKITGAFTEAKVMIWDNTLLPLWNNLKEFIEAIKEFWGVIYEGYESSGLKNVFEQIVTFFGNVFSDRISNAIKIVGNAFKTVGGIVNGIIEALTGAINFITGVFSGDWDKAWQGIKGVVKGVADGIVSFLSGLWESITIIFSPVVDFFSGVFVGAYNAIKSAFSFIGTWFMEKYKDVTGAFKNIKQYFRDAFQGAYNAVKNIWNGIGKYFKGIANDIITPIGKAVNGVIGGVNWILDKVGSKTRLNLWDVPRFASGTGGLPRDTVGVVNDQAGSTYKELIVPPSGKPFIPDGRNVVLPMEKGTKIMPAKQTKALMKGMPHFAGGIGDFLSGAWEAVKSFTGDVMHYLTNPGDIVKIALDKFVDVSSWTGIYGYMASGAVNTVFDSVVEYVERIFSTIVPKVDYNPSAGVEQWRQLAAHALKLTGQFTDANLNLLLYQMQTESGGNPNAINNWDINAQNGTPSKGLMQVIDPTFRSYAMPGYDTNIYDPLSNILASIRYTLSRYGSLSNGWKGHGYASGIGKIVASDLFPAYEVGGFPEDGLFMANHNELVGRFSNGRTAVANDYQIERGIEEATYRGYMRAHADTRETALLEEIRDAIREGRSISIDGREIVRAYDSGKARMGYPLKAY